MNEVHRSFSSLPALVEQRFPLSSTVHTRYLLTTTHRSLGASPCTADGPPARLECLQPTYAPYRLLFDSSNASTILTAVPSSPNNPTGRVHRSQRCAVPSTLGLPRSSSALHRPSTTVVRRLNSMLETHQIKQIARVKSCRYIPSSPSFPASTSLSVHPYTHDVLLEGFRYVPTSRIRVSIPYSASLRWLDSLYPLAAK